MVLNNKTRKAQAAIEFLMTYGWMLLVVLIVGALIFSFVDFGNLLPNQLELSNNFRGDATRVIASDASNEIQFVVKYVGTTAQVSLTGANPSLNLITGQNCNFTEWTVGTNTATIGDTATITNGQEAVVTFLCTTGGSSLIKGSAAEGTVNIKYSDPRTPTLLLTSAGKIRVSIQD